MKKIFILCSVVFTITLSCCKKASNEVTAYCKNTCYLCYLQSYYTDTFTFCNTDYTPQYLQEKFFDDSLQGYICNEIKPTILHEYTGDRNIVNANEDSDKANRLTCYDNAAYHPNYFDYGVTHRAMHRMLRYYYEALS